MSLPNFFVEDQVLEAETERVFALHLTPSDLKHARVLRLAAGEHISVHDAAADYFECEVVSFDDDLMVSIASRDGSSEDDDPMILLLQGLCKGEKMDTVVRHATEVGVGAFIPLVCKRSVVKLDSKKALARTKRWQTIAKSAAMQAGRSMIPEVAQPLTVDEAEVYLRGATCVLVCWEEETSTTLDVALRKALDATRCQVADARIAIIVGPEGGLDEAEVSRLRTYNPQTYSITLGKNILRTETAGIVAPALVSYQLGGLR